MIKAQIGLKLTIKRLVTKLKIKLRKVHYGRVLLQVQVYQKGSCLFKDKKV